jgi:hypothetical protein
MEKLTFIKLADIKEHIGLLDREEITMSRFAEILNERANKALHIYGVVVPKGTLCDCDDEEEIPMRWICTKCDKEWKT